MKTKRELFKDLRKYVLQSDNEVVHSLYDDLIRKRLKELDPSFLNRLDKIVEDVNFWYA